MTTDGKLWYVVLGVSPDASEAEVKQARKRLARRFHPDRNPDDPEAAEESFKRVQIAMDEYEDRGAADAAAFKRQQAKTQKRSAQAARNKASEASFGSRSGSQPKGADTPPPKSFSASPPRPRSQRPPPTWVPPASTPPPRPTASPSLSEPRSGPNSEIKESFTEVIAGLLALVGALLVMATPFFIELWLMPHLGVEHNTENWTLVEDLAMLATGLLSGCLLIAGVFLSVGALLALLAAVFDFLVAVAGTSFRRARVR
jgi:DnaJ domain